MNKFAVKTKEWEYWRNNSLSQRVKNYLKRNLYEKTKFNTKNIFEFTLLLEKVWGGEYFGELRVVDVHLGHVRQKLGREDLIATVRGVGYRFANQ